MKQVLTAIVLIICITLAGVVVSIKLGSFGPDDNYFNTRWRSKVAARPLLRSLFELHFDGDGRSDYLGGQYDRIFIEVDSMAGLSLDPAVLGNLSQKVKAITHKDVVYSVSDTNIPFSETSSVEQIQKITQQYRSVKNSSRTASLYILFVNADSESPTALGKTNQEYGIVLYNLGLKNFTKGYEATYDSYAASTLLHEFGHQLGLPHNDRSGCLMGEHAEADSKPKSSLKDIITDFCEYEKQLIDQERD